MSKNFTLYDCNLVSTCQQEDCEVLNPRTISDQVYINSTTTLTQWINSLVIPSSTTITPIYDTGIDLGTINDVHFKVPYLVKDDNTETFGIPKFDWDYFTFDTTNNKVQFNLNWRFNNVTYGSNVVNVGSIRNSANDITLCDVTIPKPLLEYTNDTSSEKLAISLNYGETTQGECYIPYEDITNIVRQASIYTQGDNITIDNGVISAVDTTYTGSNGITISSNDIIQHTNNITAGNITANRVDKGKVRIPTISYDSNGHITGSTTNDIDLNINTKSLWVSNALSSHYFRIPSGWMTGVGTDDVYGYVPLFKIIKATADNDPTDGDFRVQELFEIISRLSYIYYGKYLLGYGEKFNYEQKLLTINYAPTTNNILNIVAYYNIETLEEEGSYVNRKVITVYKKYTSAITQYEDTFIVSILGQNNPDFSVKPQNYYIYNCTYAYDTNNENVIDSTNVIKTADPSVLGTAITIV